jgi:hypothetical protein
MSNIRRTNFDRIEVASSIGFEPAFSVDTLLSNFEKLSLVLGGANVEGHGKIKAHKDGTLDLRVEKGPSFVPEACGYTGWPNTNDNLAITRAIENFVPKVVAQFFDQRDTGRDASHLTLGHVLYRRNAYSVV